MAVYGLFLHLGSSEGRKTLEQKFIFEIGTLNQSPRYQRNAFQSTNLFLQFLVTMFSTIAQFSDYKHLHNPQFPQSLWRRANTRNLSF